MRTRRSLACLLAAAALAACATQADLGGDDRTAAERRADEAAAGKMLLTLDDLPAGYRAGPVDQGDDAASARLDAGMARCMNVSRDRFDRGNPKATSPTFMTANDDTEITAVVTFTPSTTWAAKKMDLFQSDAAPRCLARVFRQELVHSVQPGVEVSEPTIDRVDVPNLGDEAVTFRMTVRISQGGQEARFHFATVLVRVGRIGVTTSFITRGEPFDPGQAADLTRLVVERAPEA